MIRKIILAIAMFFLCIGVSSYDSAPIIGPDDEISFDPNLAPGCIAKFSITVGQTINSYRFEVAHLYDDELTLTAPGLTIGEVELTSDPNVVAYPWSFTATENDIGMNYFEIVAKYKYGSSDKRQLVIKVSGDHKPVIVGCRDMKR